MDYTLLEADCREFSLQGLEDRVSELLCLSESLPSYDGGSPFQRLFNLHHAGDRNTMVDLFDVFNMRYPDGQWCVGYGGLRNLARDREQGGDLLANAAWRFRHMTAASVAPLPVPPPPEALPAPSVSLVTGSDAPLAAGKRR